jgi:hypothetical protein
MSPAVSVTLSQLSLPSLAELGLNVCDSYTYNPLLVLNDSRFNY